MNIMIKNKILMGILILLLGLFLTFSVFNVIKERKNPHQNDVLEPEPVSIKENLNKDFIYFIDEKIVSQTQNIKFKTPVLNLKQTTLNDSSIKNERLKQEQKLKEESLQMLFEYPLLSTEKSNFEADGLNSTSYRIYEVIPYQFYQTLFMADYTFSVVTGLSKQESVCSFIIDTNSGAILDKDFIFALFKMNELLIKTEILDKLKLTYKNDVDINLLTDFIKNLEYNKQYSLTLTKNGELRVNYIVKINDVIYNDVIVIQK